MTSRQRRWDSSRPVPWQRLLKEWAIVAVIGTVVIYFLTADRNVASVAYAVAWSLPMYLGVGYIMAKLGIERGSIAERRAAMRSEAESANSGASARTSRAKRPAPTRRTNANNPQRKTRSKR